MQRPALKRLLADIEAGKVDVVIVYKVDRLSRSLLDFSRMIETFDKQNVSFVSVTQEFNTTSSMGRLTLNILLSFAQFEREIISERTRDKMGAARRKGKRLGGMPVLGYDIDSQTRRFVVDPEGLRLGPGQLGARLVGNALREGRVVTPQRSEVLLQHVRGWIHRPNVIHYRNNRQVGVRSRRWRRFDGWGCKRGRS